MKKITLLLFVMLLLLGCGPLNKVVMKPYKGIKTPDKKLGIYIKDLNLEGSIKYLDDEEVIDFDIQILEGWLYKKLPLLIQSKSNVRSTKFVKKSNADELIEKEFIDWDGTIISLEVPSDSGVVKTDSVFYDYALVFDQIDAVKKKVTTYSMDANGMGNTSSTSTILFFTIKYYIWDNVDQLMVTYGEFSERCYLIQYSDKFIDTSKETVLNNLNLGLTWSELIKDTLLNTPFATEMTHW